MNLKTPRTQQTVWVLDDDETALLLAEAALTDAGFQVRTFTDAPNALGAAQIKMPDIIVVDVVMPGMDGFEFCTRLRSLPQGANVPILVTTSLDDAASIHKAYEAGATDFATKPLNWTNETYRLDYLLRSSETARELLEKEQETRLAKEDWERTFDSITDVVTVLDMDFKILRANKAAAKLFDREMAAIVGRPCYELFHGGREICPNCPAGGTPVTQLPRSAEVKCAPTGSVFEMTVSPVMDSQGRPTHLVHVARDLSEKLKLEAELRQSQKMEAIGTLAGGIAHEFNNQMMVIQGCAEMLLTDDAAMGRCNEDLEAILQAAKRASSLTQQLLIFSRKQVNFGQRAVLNLNSVLKHIMQILEKVLPKSVSPEYRLATDLRQINAHAGQLEQVMMNLAVNAAQAMPEGGALIMETQNVHLEPNFCHAHPVLEAGDYVLLTVSDTGQGMDQATLSHIYEPFFTTKKVGDGTGLGLAVVFGIVREHKGEITCQSEVGVGTTFRIYLPAVRQTAGAPPPAAAKPPPVAGGSETILVVDDEASIRNLLERHLTRLGYKVVTAAGGEIGLRLYAQTVPRPHAVILDLGMPYMSGWECLKKLRELDPQAIVLIASGNGMEGIESQALKAGASAFLGKPYDLANIASMLRKILNAPKDVNGGDSRISQPETDGNQTEPA